MTQCLQIATESIEKSMETGRMLVETIDRGVVIIHKQPAYKIEGGAERKENAYRDMLTKFIGDNREVFGGGIWFERYAHVSNRQFFSPYCMRENGVIEYVDNYSLGEGIFYTDQEWYHRAKNITKGVVWSALYYDSFADASMVTVAAPFYDESGRLLGVATIDLDLFHMQKMIAELDVAANGVSFVVDDEGTYITHEHSENILNANILEDTDPTIQAFAREMIGQGNGKDTYMAGGQQCHAWYHQIPQTGWYIVTATFSKDMLADASALGKALTTLCILFSMILFIALYLYLQANIINPAHSLADSAEQIANGKLSVEIGKFPKNEFGVMGNFIRQMTFRLR